MPKLSKSARGGPPPVTRFQAGKLAPGKVPNLSVAATMVQAPGEAAMLVVSPADTTVYYYMEGMIGPMGSYSTYGRIPRAVGVVDRSVRETEKGVYAAKIRVPKAGDYNVAFLIDSPTVDQCFTALWENQQEKN